MLYLARITRSIALLAAAMLAGCWPATPPQLARQGQPPRPMAQAAPETVAAPDSTPAAYLLHLPGVSGECRVDHWLSNGLSAGRIGAQIEIHDWTEGEHGVTALQGYERNRERARLLARALTARVRSNPAQKVYVTAHSGGAGLAVWMLEDLPDDVRIDSLLLLAPALSPEYDLSRALRHVSRGAYAFYSERDTVVLSTGTKLFGTIDGAYRQAAGFCGFVRPAGADASQYAKLRQFAYDKTWMRYGNAGDHIGVMSWSFAREVLAPLLERGQEPAGGAAPATQATPAVQAAEKVGAAQP